MLIEIAYKPSCPCGAEAEANLAEALRKLDIDPLLVRRYELGTQEDAERLGIAGCPTIRVNGLHADVTRRYAREATLECQTTPHKKGPPTRAPTVADVIVTIKKTTCTRFGCC